jgi:glycerol dehydrogenase-like iron-containing ADH family enzyme
MLSIFSEVMPKKENEELEKELENKFYSQAKVSQDIEEIYTKNSDMNYIDSVMHFCEKNKIDIESIPKLISKPLKEKIKYDAMELNFLKRSSRAKLSI